MILKMFGCVTVVALLLMTFTTETIEPADTNPGCKQIWGVNVCFHGSSGGGVAVLSFSDASGWYLLKYPCWHADQIIAEAERRGYTVSKSQTNMAKEIWFHAFVYLIGAERASSNPIHIDLYTGRWLPPDEWLDWMPWWALVEEFPQCK